MNAYVVLSEGGLWDEMIWFDISLFTGSAFVLVSGCGEWICWKIFLRGERYCAVSYFVAIGWVCL